MDPVSQQGGPARADGPTLARCVAVSWAMGMAPCLATVSYAGQPLFSGPVAAAAALLLVPASVAGLVVHRATQRARLALLTLGTLFSLDLFGLVWTYGPGVLAVAAPVLALLALAGSRAVDVLGVAFGTLVLTVPLASHPDPSAREIAAPAGGEGLPVVVHVLLDEHLGLPPRPTGLPGADAYVAEARERWSSAGFLVFGNAYGETDFTNASMWIALNDEPEPPAENRGFGFDDWDRTRSIGDARYLQEVTRRGYRLHVLQPRSLDYCGVADVATCASYEHTDMSAPAVQDLPVGDRLRILASIQLSHTRSWHVVRHVVTLWVRRLVGHNPDFLPLAKARATLFGWERSRVGALSQLDDVDRWMQRVEQARPGDYFYLHLLMPHYPTTFAEDCSLLPVSRWTGAHEAMLIEDRDAFRADFYALYLGNAACVDSLVLERLEAVAAARPDLDLVFLVHGDHGPRIFLSAEAERVPQIDTYATLFALRLPGAGGDFDDRYLPLRALLWGTLEAGFRSAPSVEEPAEPTVFSTLARTGRLPYRPAEDARSDGAPDVAD